MSLQTNYSETQVAGLPGARATMLRGDIISRTVETAAIAFGKAVSNGAADKGCKEFGGADTQAMILGIAIIDRSASGLTVVNGQVTGQTLDAFGVGESARILTVGSGGDVWVTCASGCTAGDPVYVRPSNGDFQDSNANSAIQILGARYDTSAGAGEIAVVRLA